MQDGLPIEIRTYDESLAEGIAQMWNTWDALWPGSFTRGVPYTAERVKKQWDKISALALLVAIDRATNRPIGSCTLHPSWRDKEAAYIGTLGVSPDALNKKVGKQLLLESIRICSAMGYTRVDLNTWPGNLRAVPLYKKVGMMWDPEGQGMTMFDYIPGILSHPLCKPFFDSLDEEHSWYDVHIRDPTQAPDDYSDLGMAIYPYEFKFGDSTLSVTVDRFARGITAMHQTLSGRTIGFSARVDSHEAICGVPQNYSLDIENGTESDMHVSIQLGAFEGLEFDSESSKEFDISPRTKNNWTVQFHLTSSAPLFRENIKTPYITANISIDGEVSTLITGLKIRSPAEIRARSGESLVRKMGECHVPLTILSNLDKSSVAHIHLNNSPSNMEVSLETDSIDLAPYGQGGATLEVSASKELEEGVHYLPLSLSLNIADEKIVQTRDFTIPIFCLGEKEIAMGEDVRSLESIIVSPFYTAKFAHEGAGLSLEDRYSQNSLGIFLASEIGPPFGINPFRFAERKVKATHSDNGLVVSMTASHPDRPLVVEDRAIFEYGTGVIKHEQWVTNLSSESQCFQSRLLGRRGGIVFGSGDIYIPLSEGLFKEPIGNSLFEYPYISSSPSAFSEGWIAVENDESTIGQIWNLDDVEEIFISTGNPQAITYPEVTLGPGEKRKVTDTWLILNARSWKDIQRQWSSRVNHRYNDRYPIDAPKAPRQIISVTSDPVVLPYLSDTKMKIRVNNPLQISHSAQFEVVAPDGWNLTTNEKSKSRKAVQKDIVLSSSEPYDFDLAPTTKVQDAFGIHKGYSRLKMEYDITEPVRIITLGSSKDRVRITKQRKQGCQVYHVQNALLDFAASADYGGCLFSLRNHNGVEYLTSSFPKATPRPGAWFENYYGGVQPIIYDFDLGEPLTKARTNKETMSAKPYHNGPWSGIEISWKGSVQRITHGIQSRLRYLAAAGCPLVLIQWILTNTTTAPIRFYPTLSIDTKLDAELARSQFQTEWSGKVSYIRPRDVAMIVTPTSNLIWLMPENTNGKARGISLIVQNESASMFDGYFGSNLAMATTFDFFNIRPREERTMLACLYIDPPNWETLTDVQSMLGSLIPHEN